MTCTLYNEPIGYNIAIPYNGTCVTPIPSGGGGFGAFSDVFYTPFPPIEDDEGMIITLLGLLEDDY